MRGCYDAPVFLTMLLACASPEVPSCVAPDDPPGDPISRDCVIYEADGDWLDERTTDDDGRTVFERQAMVGESWIWSFDWSDVGLTHEREVSTGPDGTIDAVEDLDWTFDAHGNPLTSDDFIERPDRTTPPVHVHCDIAPSLDDEDRPVTTITACDGQRPTIRSCTYSDADGPDQCEDDVTDALGQSGADGFVDRSTTWSYDADGGVVDEDEISENPGWTVHSTWTRDGSGRTRTLTTSDSTSGDSVTGQYVYDGLALDHVDVASAGVDNGELTETFTYERL